MRMVGKILKWLVALVVAAVAGLSAWLYFAPPALIRVGSGYAAKIVCSNVFIANRDAGEVLADDVQAPGHPLLRLMAVDVDDSAGTVRAGLFGIFGRGLAVVHDGAGCSNVPDGDVAAAALGAIPAATAAKSDGLWPEGDKVDASQDPAIAAILDDAGLAGPGMRAIVVVQNGRIVGERYGEGFGPGTPLLGWSMTKTVTAAIIGTLVGDGRMSVDKTGLFEAWKADGRNAISLADLMAMSSGLEFNEDYGDVTDVTRMLYLVPDMASFAAAKPLAGAVGKVFSYSSGTTLILSRLWQDAVGDPATALAWPQEKLFGPLGMTSAVLEADARGTFAGSSYLYATAHDWARFGQFLLQDGAWNGTRVLPEGYVAWMREAAPASNGDYGRGQLWLRGPEGGSPEGEDPDAGFDLPSDTFWMQGHDGQTVAMVPSAGLVVVRMGLTPSKLHYKPQAMLAALAAALK
ncbi:6-aminohexanoate hydrolase [Aminobacter sp. DSM 101952]|uniref:serine hydrolase domain-containing protein n=1 Tax=Aminobacter sp. DSM 101952 TaxID=2735891 RepID=UPI0006F7D130|nr:serine hydrolase [Aminobacter sp. DSM 101952]KQU76356.1 6-aminohexanoate hydrolase [Aminobacter sp. DSM 101952]